MKTIRWNCDLCGKEIKLPEDRPVKIEAYAVDPVDDDPSDTLRVLGATNNDFMSGFDFCTDCMNYLMGRLETIVKTQKNKEKEPVSKEIPLDEDKLRSLYSAGWSYKDLATEFRVSDQTIRNRLKKIGAYLPDDERQKKAAAAVEQKKERIEEWG